MYLNGKKLQEAARSLNMSPDDLARTSGLAADEVAYYLENAVTVTNQEDVDALAKALGIKAELLIVKGEPKGVTLRPDKFVSQKGDIVIKRKKPKEH